MFDFLIITESAIFIILTLILTSMFRKEGESMAVRKVFLLGSLIILCFLVFYIFRLETIYYIFLVGDILLFIVLIMPYNPKLDIIDFIPKDRIDERDIMFSRKELKKGSARYDEYYYRNPSKKLKDDAFRREPGLLSAQAQYFHAEAFSKAEQYFKKVDTLYPRIYQPASNKYQEKSNANLENEIKKLAKSLGAISIGFTKTEAYHYYSYKGRREEYGNELIQEHPFAIAITVEMDHEMVMAAPKAPIVMESAKQYYRSGKIAVEIAELLGAKGFEARAHIDGNYRVICPLIARDAGLGEIGRMGLLMTPNLGPRVRIAVITTNATVSNHHYKPDYSVIDFCRICKKCSECCPSQSISLEDPVDISGNRRWQIDQESCFTYWCKTGTDCGRCMAVCPYSHPNHSLHKLIRKGISNSRIFRWFALSMDDVFYGRKPKPKPIPELKDRLKSN